jgi:hypothetical protein
MRLLNTHSLELATFIGSIPHYAILSHRWEAEELTFEDIAKSPLSDPDSPARTKLGFSKVAGTCALAAKDGFDWVWIDSLCIDKASSSELQEAINSMFNWYAEAQLCYAFLSDVPNEDSGWNEDFGKSLWFTRAWTLQELLAPCAVEFYAADWSLIGTRPARYTELSRITGIASAALTKAWSQVKDAFLAAQKLSWAAHRHASRSEDAAYSLLGLFDVNMPMLYGEGERKAFLRLQKAIYKKDADHSLFLFRPHLGPGTLPLFGENTSGYCQNIDCRLCSLDGRGQGVYHNISYSTLSITRDHRGTIESDHFIRVVRSGVMVKLPTIKLKEVPSQFISSLVSEVASYPTTAIGADVILAILNLSSHGQGTVVIPLRLEGYESYHRQMMWPIFLPHSFSSLGIMCLPIMVHLRESYDYGGVQVVHLRVQSSSNIILWWGYQDTRNPNLTRELLGLDDYVWLKTGATPTAILKLMNIGSSRFSLKCTFGFDGDTKDGNVKLVDAQIINTAPVTDGKQVPLHQSGPTRRLGNQAIFPFSDNLSVYVALRRLAPSAKYCNDAQYRLDVERKPELPWESLLPGLFRDFKIFPRRFGGYSGNGA